MAVLLAEHRLERCLAAADRVVALDRGRIAFDGPPRGFGDWALDADPALATPGARCSRSPGCAPPARLGEGGAGGAGGIASGVERGARAARRASPRRRCGGGRRERRARGARRSRDLWVELDRGIGRARCCAASSSTLEPGERVALMGRNGAGKSTLLRAAAGLIEPGRGPIGRPAAARCCPRAPPTSSSASGSATSCRARRGARRSPRSASSGRPSATRATSPAASASGSRWRS